MSEPVDPLLYKFFLNPYPDLRFSRCPRCGRNTKARRRMLIVQPTPEDLTLTRANCRYCSECNLLIAHLDEIARMLEQPSAQELTVVGMIDPDQLRGRQIEGLALEEIAPMFLPFQNQVHFDLVPGPDGIPRTVEIPLADKPGLAEVPTPTLGEVEQLDQYDETWQIGVHKLQTWITGETEGVEEPYRPYGILIVGLPGPMVVFHEILETAPSVHEILDALLTGMVKPTPAPGSPGPRRPILVQLDDASLIEALAPRLADLNIRLEYAPTPHIDEVLAEMARYMREGRDDIPGLLDAPGVNPEQVADLFAAAADFYRAAPWRFLYNDDLIAVRYPSETGEWRYVSVMGNGGIEYGLAVFESLIDYSFTANLAAPGLGADQMTYRSLTYDDITVVPFRDLDAVEKYQWEVAAKEAYPIFITFTKDQRLLRPDAQELFWYQVALEAIPAFVEEYWPDNLDEVPAPVYSILSMTLSSGQEIEVDLKYPAATLDEEEWEAMGSQVYRFKVQFKHRKGLWRRIEVLGNQMLADFDGMIREAFQHDLTDHMSGFWLVGNQRRQDVELGDINPLGEGTGADIPIGAIDLAPKAKLKYVYDFGDWVEHLITLEAIDQAVPDADYPRVVAQNKPRYRYCELCRTEDKKTVAAWICLDCSNEEQRQVLICEEHLDSHHEDHYAEEMLY